MRDKNIHVLGPARPDTEPSRPDGPLVPLVATEELRDGGNALVQPGERFTEPQIRADWLISIGAAEASADQI